MSNEDFPPLARAHGPRMRQAVRDETDHPAPVRRTEIAQRHGPGQRVLGLPTVVERVSQQAMAQGVGPSCDPGFSASRCGVRPRRAAPQAVKQRPGYSQAGDKVGVDLDLANFCARASHEAVRARGARKVRDQARLGLIGT